ncbi:MAG: PucR family transcriptional regulator [bacterium]
MLPINQEKVASFSAKPKLQKIFANLSHSTREAFSFSIIGPLVRSPYGPDLIRTLEQFLSDNLNVSQAAKHLFLHRNTLLYRLAKIRRLTGLDPRNFDEAMQLKLALMLWSQNDDQPSQFFRRVEEHGEHSHCAMR